MTQVDGAPAVAVRDAPPLRALPPALAAALVAAFSQELAERLPRLAAAARTPTPELLTQALRDAHALGSSADLVGAGEAARTARGAEALLRRWSGGEDRAAVALAPLIDLLHVQLARWRA